MPESNPLDLFFDADPVEMDNGKANAYPLISGIAKPEFGLTKRELFAAMAMQGMIASGEAGLISHESVATQSLKLADALIAQLANS